MRCNLDGVEIGCGWVMQLMDIGAATRCPNDDCGPQRRELTTSDGQRIPILTNPFQSFSDGTQGYFPVGTRYVGDGIIFNSWWTGGGEEKAYFNTGGELPDARFFFSSPQNPTGGQPPTIRPLTPEETAEQRRLLVNTLENPTFPLCKPFMSALLNELGAISGVAPYSNDPVAVFDRIASLPGAMTATTEPGVMGRAGGSAGAGTAVFRLNLANMRTLSTAGAARLHETTHAAAGAAYSGYSHLQMNQATFNILGRMGLVTRLGLTFDPTANNGDGTNYAGGLMDAICHQ